MSNASPFSFHVRITDGVNTLGELSTPLRFPSCIYAALTAVGISQNAVVCVKSVDINGNTSIVALSDDLPPGCLEVDVISTTSNLSSSSTNVTSAASTIASNMSSTPQTQTSSNLNARSVVANDWIPLPTAPTAPSGVSAITVEQQVTVSSVSPSPTSNANSANAVSVNVNEIPAEHAICASNQRQYSITTITAEVLFKDKPDIIAELRKGVALHGDKDVFFRARCAYNLGVLCNKTFQPSKHERRLFMETILNPYNIDVDTYVSKTKMRGTFDSTCNNVTTSMSRKMGISRRKRRHQGATPPVVPGATVLVNLHNSVPGSDLRRTLITETYHHRQLLAASNAESMIETYPLFWEDHSVALHDLSRKSGHLDVFNREFASSLTQRLDSVLNAKDPQPNIQGEAYLSVMPNSFDQTVFDNVKKLFILSTTRGRSTHLDRLKHFFNFFPDITTPASAVTSLRDAGVEMPSIARLGLSVQEPYYVIYNERYLHIKANFMTSMMVLFSFYYTFNIKYPSCVRSMMRLIAALMKLPDDKITYHERQLLAIITE